MRVSGAAVSDEGSKMKDESRSLLPGRKRKYVMAEPFTDHEDPNFVVEHERLGTIEAFREGLAELRALEGRPVVRRRRTWVAACEIGTVELVQGYGKSGKFFLEQRGRDWLGKSWSCSDWVCQNQNSQDSPNFRIEQRIREVVREAALSSERCEKRTGWFVVIVGTEVSEKRGRHWVRLPYCCGVRVASVEQDSQNSQDSQGHGEEIQDLGNCQGDLEVDGIAVEFKGVRVRLRVDLVCWRGLGFEGWDGLAFKVLNGGGWIGLGP